MLFRPSAEIVLLLSITLLSCKSVQCRPQENDAQRRESNDLTKETQIGESKVYGLIHDDSEGKDAKQEKEDFDSKVLSVFENVQQKIINAWNPGAVIDKTKPEDWERNPIEDYEALRSGIVGVVDFIAKQINAVLDTPRKVTKKVNKSITRTLNDIGNKLVGLE
ncbi:uncharacterized protein LOC131693891 [Topomyia yanbarensis]|uniref:uncharacterized protein LOC131693891 n=1 Tax=Topomyia yanbarensis TaxID=2498891 RepID=UPI00273BA7F2|nr:uncharacterized protein LOC131693891 [Topomyia yanbarensis]